MTVFKLLVYILIFIASRAIFEYIVYAIKGNINNRRLYDVLSILLGIITVLIIYFHDDLEPILIVMFMYFLKIIYYVLIVPLEYKLW